MRFFISNGLGDAIDSPSAQQMRAFLDDLDVTDEELGAAWLSTEDGASLEWNWDERLVLSVPGGSSLRHLRGVSREHALELWIKLTEGGLGEVETCAWQPGHGVVVSPARDAELREWQRVQDREFYELLGEERASVRCREEGCTRGAIALSVHCRPHHFEAIKKRASPFDD